MVSYLVILGGMVEVMGFVAVIIEHLRLMCSVDLGGCLVSYRSVRDWGGLGIMLCLASWVYLG